MPQPSDVHVSTLLTSVSVAYLQDPNKFIADIVFPRVPTEKKSNKWATFTIDDFLRNQMAVRAPGADAFEASYTVSKDSFDCEVFALRRPIDDQEEANQDSVFNADSDTTEFLTQQELIKREVEWATGFFGTSLWTGGTTLAGAHADIVGGTDFAQWDDISSDPIGDVKRQARSMEQLTGFWPTDLTITRPVWDSLSSHPDIISRISGGATTGNAAIVTRQLVAALFEIERINVASAIQNTAQEGVAKSTGYILGRHALLTYRPARMGLKTPSAGATFVWSGLVGSEEGRRILRYDKPPHVRYIEIESAWDQKVVAPDLGVFFQNAVSASA